MNHNLYLIERKAPTPEEKEIIEDIPFMQGVLDFSMILGERVFKNREIEYKFKLFDTDYSQRKVIETRIKQELMPFGEQKLIDSHDIGYHWLGKCKEVDIENDEQFRSMIITIKFECYPFLIGQNSYFTDIWDDFNFETDVANFTKYEVNGTKTIYLYNASANSVKPEIVATSDFNVFLNQEKFVFKTGKSSNILFSLATGLNKLTVEGNGTIAFHYRIEVMA